MNYTILFLITLIHKGTYMYTSNTHQYSPSNGQHVYQPTPDQQKFNDQFSSSFRNFPELKVNSEAKVLFIDLLATHYKKNDTSFNSAILKFFQFTNLENIPLYVILMFPNAINELLSISKGMVRSEDNLDEVGKILYNKLDEISEEQINYLKGQNNLYDQDLEYLKTFFSSKESQEQVVPTKPIPGYLPTLIFKGYSSRSTTTSD